MVHLICDNMKWMSIEYEQAFKLGHFELPYMYYTCTNFSARICLENIWLDLAENYRATLVRDRILSLIELKRIMLHWIQTVSFGYSEVNWNVVFKYSISCYFRAYIPYNYKHHQNPRNIPLNSITFLNFIWV